MVLEQAIRQRSYEIWQREGCPSGKSLEHWLRAEAELLAEQARKQKARTFPYHATLYRFEEWQRAVLPKPRISVPPQVTMARRVARDNHPAAA
jgi:hypothetical protein